MPEIVHGHRGFEILPNRVGIIFGEPDRPTVWFNSLPVWRSTVRHPSVNNPQNVPIVHARIVAANVADGQQAP